MIKVLIVARIHPGNRFAYFVEEQIKALEDEGCDICKFAIEGKGISAFINSIKPYKDIIKEYSPDIIHAHYGICGLFANIQRKIPVVTTYHGSDIHSTLINLLISKASILLSSHNIFVCKKLASFANVDKKNTSIIPCGVDTSIFFPENQQDAICKTALNPRIHNILFSSAYNNPVKNYPLAKSTVNLLPESKLIELDGLDRDSVRHYLNACDCLLLTSKNEGSPMVIKEALACNTKIVSVDVGDVKEIIGNVNGCYIAQNNVSDLLEKLKECIGNRVISNGRDRIRELQLSTSDIAKRIIQVYTLVKND